MTAGRLKIWNDLAGEWQYTPGGGSQPVRVIGPVTIGFAEFDDDGDVVSLFDTTAGDVLLNAWYDTETAVNWDDAGISGIFFAEDPPGGVFHTTSNWDFSLGVIEPGGSIADLQVADGTAGSDHFVGGSTTLIGQQIFGGGVFKAYNRDGAGDAAQGSIDLYFLVATPVAP